MLGGGAAQSKRANWHKELDKLDFSKYLINWIGPPSILEQSRYTEGLKCECKGIFIAFGLLMVGSAERVTEQWRSRSGSRVRPLTVFVNDLFPPISLIRRLRFSNCDYYARWWMEITFPLIANPPIFTTSHRSPRPLSTTTPTNWADDCKMCVVAEPVRVGVGGGGAVHVRRVRGFYPARLLRAPTWDKRNKGLMSNILPDGHGQRGRNY